MIRRVTILLFVLLIGAAVAGAWLLHQRLVTPFRGFQGDQVLVDIPAGTTELEIARRLADAGVVPDTWTFRIAARQAHADRKLQAGEYRFTDPATPEDIVSRLARGDVYTRGVTFPEGLTIREMAPIFENAGLGTAAEFELAASDGTLAASFDLEARTLEGYLFPSTYAMSHLAGASATAAAMVAQFERVFDAAMRDAAAARQMSVRQAVTLASLIEKETAQPAERPIVSAVYHNRLAAGMPLQCDPTVVYALMLARTWHGNISKSDLDIKSPYNTYKYAGLPPGPIASPGRASLEAAVNPADVRYLYFVSRNDGTHVFASSLAEHNRNVARWQVRFFKGRRN